MLNPKHWCLLNIFLLLLFTSVCHAQPLTRDTLNRFPDSITIQGKLIDYKLGFSCGITCGCGTLKIKLTQKNAAYVHDFIYVAEPCMNTLPNNFKTTTTWKLYKLPITENSCFFTELPMNKFDTKGLAFYTLINRQKK